MKRQFPLRARRRTPDHSFIEVLESRIAPATFVVLNLNDSGSGSLRDAIAQANALGGPDTITFHSGLRGTIALTSGELKVTDEVTINGPGGNEIILDGLNQSRVFLIDDGTSTDRPATLSGLTIIDGNSASDLVSGPNGGGILSAESLTLKNCVISGNTSVSSSVEGNGAGVAVSSLSGSVNIVDTQISNNLGATGGGLYLYAGKSITIKGGKIVNNSSGDYAGGGAFLKSAAAVSTSMAVENTLVQGNAGGGLSIVHNQGALTISGCQLIDNNAQGGVGGGMAITANGNVLVEKTSVTDNRAIDEGGGLFFKGSAPISIVSSKITGNQLIDAGVKLYGAGIYLYGNRPVTIAKSTISGNGVVPHTDTVLGGGIAAINGVALTISKSQIANNFAPDGGGGIFTDSMNGQIGSLTLNDDAILENVTSTTGGGIEAISGALTMKNTMVSGNSGGKGEEASTPRAAARRRSCTRLSVKTLD